MPFVTGFLRLRHRGHIDNSLPGSGSIDNSLPETPVDPGFGGGLPSPVDPDFGLPVPPPGVWPPPNATLPIIPAPPGTPPGVIWPPIGKPPTWPGMPDNTLPPQIYWVVVGIPGVGWRYTTVDPSLQPTPPMAPGAEPK